eukprot:164054-Prymnesium_polylepis.2
MGAMAAKFALLETLRRALRRQRRREEGLLVKVHVIVCARRAATEHDAAPQQVQAAHELGTGQAAPMADAYVWFDPATWHSHSASSSSSSSVSFSPRASVSDSGTSTKAPNEMK